jgi:hypothetical protein
VVPYRAAAAGPDAETRRPLDRASCGRGGDLLEVPNRLPVARPPEDFPSWQTVWWRFDRWAKDGTWDRVLSELQGEAHAAAELEWLVSVDSTVARAHQHAAGARKISTGGSAESHDSAA